VHRHDVVAAQEAAEVVRLKVIGVLRLLEESDAANHGEEVSRVFLDFDAAIGVERVLDAERVKGPNLLQERDLVSIPDVDVDPELAHPLVHDAREIGDAEIAPHRPRLLDVITARRVSARLREDGLGRR
jgi:hypothetical protein